MVISQSQRNQAFQQQKQIQQQLANLEKQRNFLNQRRNIQGKNRNQLVQRNIKLNNLNLSQQDLMSRQSYLKDFVSQPTLEQIQAEINEKLRKGQYTEVKASASPKYGGERRTIGKVVNTSIGDITITKGLQGLTLREVNEQTLSPSNLDTQISSSNNIPSGVISAVEKKTGFAGLNQKIGKLKTILQDDISKQSGLTQEFTAEKLRLLGLASAGVSTLTAISNPIQTAKTIPSALKEAGSRLASGKGFPEVSQALISSPEFTQGQIAGNYLIGKGVGKATTLARDLGEIGITKLSPKYRPVVSGVIKNVDDGLDIPLAGSVKSLSEPLTSQVELAGKKVTAVSASKNLFKPLRSQVEINKPLPEGDFHPLEQTFFADPRGRLRPSRLGVYQKEAKLFDYLADDVTFRRSKPQAIYFKDVQIAKFPPALRSIEQKLKKGLPLSPLEQQKLLKFELSITGEFKPIGYLSQEPEVVLAKGEVIKKVKVPSVTLINGRRVPIIKAVIVRDSEASTLYQKLINGKGSLKDLKNLNSRTGIDFSSILYKGKYASPYKLATKGVVSIGSAFSKTTTTSKTISPFTIGKTPSIATKITQGKTIGGTPSLSTRKGISVGSPTSIFVSRLKPISPFKSRPYQIKRNLSAQRRSSTTQYRSSIMTYPTKTSSNKKQYEFRQRLTGSPSSPIKTGKPSIPITPYPFTNGKVALVKNKKEGNAYDVYVKKKGKFVKINKSPLTRERALDTGAFNTARTLRASFTLKPTIGKVGTSTAPKNFFKSTRLQFRKSKKDRNVYVERRKFRLNSQPEKIEIKQARRKIKWNS